jgi:hypothetical protein
MYTQTRFRHLVIDFVYDGPPTQSELAAIEDELGVSLPSDFIEFLKVANGGYLEYCIDVEHPEGTESMCFCGLYGTKPDPEADTPSETLLYQLETEREYKQIPRQVLPFACNGGGSTVYLDLTAKGNGRVVAYVHGLPAWAGVSQSDAYVPVADNFSDYLTRLYVDEDGMLDKLKSATEEDNSEWLKKIARFLDISDAAWRSKESYKKYRHIK